MLISRILWKLNKVYANCSMPNMYLSFWGTLSQWALAAQDNQAVVPFSATYNKRLHLNRTMVLGGQGAIALSIPLLGGRDQSGLLKDIKVAFPDDDWRRKHRRTIESCYRKAPFFDYYAPAVLSLYEHTFEFLWQWQFESWKTVSKLLKCSLEIGWTEGKIEFENLSEKSLLKPYPQLFSDRYGFQETAGFLDLLFCMGPSLINYLSHSSTNEGYIKP